MMDLDDRTDPDCYEKARSELLSLSREEAELTIEWMADALDSDATREDGFNRWNRYWVLAVLEAARTDSGYKQLILGLEEERQRSLCVDALSRVPEERRKEVGERFCAMMDDAIWEREGPGFFRCLGRLGDGARCALPRLEAILKAPDAELRKRGAAAGAILGIAGPDYTLARFAELDELGLGVGVSNIAAYFGEADSKRKVSMTPDELSIRRKARELALRAVYGSDPAVRQRGFEGLYLFFGDDLLVGDESTGFQLHPDYVAAIEHLANNEPDVGLRSRAQQARDGLEVQLARVIRDRKEFLRYQNQH